MGSKKALKKVMQKQIVQQIGVLALVGMVAGGVVRFALGHYNREMAKIRQERRQFEGQKTLSEIIRAEQKMQLNPDAGFVKGVSEEYLTRYHYKTQQDYLKGKPTFLDYVKVSTNDSSKLTHPIPKRTNTIERIPLTPSPSLAFLKNQKRTNFGLAKKRASIPFRSKPILSSKRKSSYFLRR
jgi:hypothetical protein